MSSTNRLAVSALVTVLFVFAVDGRFCAVLFTWNSNQFDFVFANNQLHRGLVFLGRWNTAWCACAMPPIATISMMC